MLGTKKHFPDVGLAVLTGPWITGSGAVASCLVSLLLFAPTADAVATPDQQSGFVAQVKTVLGKGTKGWVARQDIINRGLSVCAGLVKTGYSPQSIDYQAARLTPAEYSRFPIRRLPARRVVAAAIQYLCPMPPPPTALVLPEGWVRKP